MEGRQERVEPLDCAHDVSSSSGEVEAVARGDRSMQQCRLLVVMAISDGSCLTVLAAASCDVGVVAYEMTVLVTRAGDVLTPSLRAELQAALPR